MTLDHVGIAVNSIEESLPFYKERLGLEVVHREKVPSQGVEVAFLGRGPSTVELLEPLDESGAVAGFLKKRGPGLHHVAFKTADIREQMQKLRKEGTELLQREPRPGARQHSVCFIHPRSSGGTLIELVERDGRRA